MEEIVVPSLVSEKHRMTPQDKREYRAKKRAIRKSERAGSERIFAGVVLLNSELTGIVLTGKEVKSSMSGRQLLRSHFTGSLKVGDSFEVFGHFVCVLDLRAESTAPYYSAEVILCSSGSKDYRLHLYKAPPFDKEAVVVTCVGKRYAGAV